MGIGKRHETPGSEKKKKKNFITHSTARSMIINTFVPIHMRTTDIARVDGCKRVGCVTGEEH